MRAHYSVVITAIGLALATQALLGEHALVTWLDENRVLSWLSGPVRGHLISFLPARYILFGAICGAALSTLFRRLGPHVTASDLAQSVSVSALGSYIVLRVLKEGARLAPGSAAADLTSNAGIVLLGSTFAGFAVDQLLQHLKPPRTADDYQFDYVVSVNAYSEDQRPLSGAEIWATIRHKSVLKECGYGTTQGYADRPVKFQIKPPVDEKFLYLRARYRGAIQTTRIPLSKSEYSFVFADQPNPTTKDALSQSAVLQRTPPSIIVEMANALSISFSFGDIQELAMRLNIDPETFITIGEAQSAATLNFVKAADRRGCLRELVVMARDDRPHNTTFINVALALGIEPPRDL